MAASLRPTGLHAIQVAEEGARLRSKVSSEGRGALRTSRPVAEKLGAVDKTQTSHWCLDGLLQYLDWLAEPPLPLS